MKKQYCWTCGKELKLIDLKKDYNNDTGESQKMWLCPNNEGKRWFWQKHTHYLRLKERLFLGNINNQ